MHNKQVDEENQKKEAPIQRGESVQARHEAKKSEEEIKDDGSKTEIPRDGGKETPRVTPARTAEEEPNREGVKRQRVDNPARYSRR